MDKDKVLENEINALFETLDPYISKKEIFEQAQDEVALILNNSSIQFPRVLDDKYSSYRIKNFNYNNKKYYCGIYDYYLTKRDKIEFDNDPKLMMFNKYEIMEYSKTESYKLQTVNDTLIPLLVQNNDQIINININNENIKLKELLPERFHYYKIPQNSKVEITSNSKFILGKEVKLKKDKKLPSLVLNIFVDGLSQKYLDDNDLSEVAPNIYKFFNKGTICTNAHTTGEWTYPSIASIFTGMHTTSHRVFHPNYDTLNIKNYELYSEVFNKLGFQCTKIDADYRSNPALGYMKGFDRYLYQLATRGMFVNDVITETIENIEAFKDTNNFMWICIPDLHDIADRYEEAISAQVHTSIKNRQIEEKDSTSVRQKYSFNLMERYKSQLKRIDTYLGLLFNYINDNFDNNEVVVGLMSDHGQGYLIKSNEFIDEERSNIAMMFRGKGIPNGICTELVSILDFFPIILNSIGITDYEKKESNVPKYFGGDYSREYTYTESLHPNSPYHAVINDLKYKFFFTTNKLNTNDGRVCISSEEDFTYSLINKSTSINETDENPKLVEYYKEIVLSHIKDYIVI